MSDKLDAMIYKDISELRARRDLARRTLNRLSDELEHIDSETEKASMRLKALRRELAVSEREIQDSQGVIFRLDRHRKKMDEASSVFFKDFESREAELRELNKSKNTLNTDIENIESDIQQTSEAIFALEAEIHRLSSRVDEMEAEKRELSGEISRILSRTSLDKDKIEEELNELSASFFKSIATRDALEQRLSALEAAIKGMTDTISELAEKVTLLEDIKALQGERGGLKADVEERKSDKVSLSARLEELQSILEVKQEQADRLSTENAERKYSVDSLEKEVMVYDKAVTGLAGARERLRNSSKEAEHNRDVLKQLLVDKAKLEEELIMVMEKVSKTVEVVKSVS